ncbi:hypothetical protein [Iodidimonas sp. SYSU 1G8]|uniref:hypothetical protein n=1 Tax=Iodidimonas sp. SYSU 1G8 TaxID=3133967 RepID=UPI0031FEE8C6
MNRVFAGLLVIAGLVVGTGAARADGSAIHGFVDVSLKNAYITPRGLLVVDDGATIQVLNGLVINVYDAPDETLKGISLVFGTWNDIATEQKATNVGAWNEFDWFVGANFSLGDRWTLGAQYVEFISPPNYFKTERNMEFTLSYDDGVKDRAFSLQPYVKVFWAISGDSTVVTGKRGNTFDVEIGAKPNISFDLLGAPATLSAPTWVTVGPKSYWGGTSNFGVFTTGLNLKLPLQFIPPKYGNWYTAFGVQYYNLLNRKLRDAQALTGAVGPLDPGHKEVVVGSFSVGFGF